MTARPRTIADSMIAEMRKAAGKVWLKHVEEIPEGDRAEWERLVKRHVGLWFGKSWG